MARYNVTESVSVTTVNKIGIYVVIKLMKLRHPRSNFRPARIFGNDEKMIQSIEV